jgi:hypothetical protein
MTNAYKTSVMKPQGTTWHIYPYTEEEHEMDVRETSYEGMNCIELAQHMVQWWNFMYFQIP